MRLFAALLLAGCIGTAGANPIARVAVATPEPATFGERFSLTGTLTAERAAALSPRVDGLVAQLLVDAGDSVREGQALLRLDTTIAVQTLARAAAATAEAEAAADEARRRLREGETLAARKFIPASQVDTLRAAEKLAQAGLASARAAQGEQRALLERHVLPAPFSGVIAERMTEVGQWAARGTPVLRLVALETVWLDVRVPQERHADFGGKIAATVFPDALPGTALPARIIAKVPVSAADARTFLLRLAVDNDDARLIPGTSARAEFALPAADSVLAIARDALLRQPDGGYSLFVVEAEGGRQIARLRSVRLLRDQGERVAIASGLDGDERVVVSAATSSCATATWSKSGRRHEFR
jgi:RND family efflux transporter MFP subunit